ncbi:hypothetical protein PanWU01x14_225720 [Parasponia andersonii]|uniref:Uncharacterized protein n=1 Tax=Parasponia andersonii TaxID=3476 RepID=A0A2P5BMA7_PARAD|nr:hypothetical protein PanWU01x14_225720 [Parasponia andersonii]
MITCLAPAHLLTNICWLVALLLPNQETTILQKPPTESTFLPHNRPPPFPQTPNPPNLPQSLLQIRTRFLPLVRVPPRGRRLIRHRGRGMLHQKRHRSGQPPPSPHGEAPRLQLHRRRGLPLRGPLAQPPPHRGRRDLLLRPPQPLPRDPKRRDRTITPQNLAKLSGGVLPYGCA